MSGTEDLKRTYLGRHVDVELDELMTGIAAIALDGPKAVGKTATALRRARTSFRLDHAQDRELVHAQPDYLTEGKPPILIDEWQKYPESWDRVRRAVDDGAQPGSFLLTGSAAPITPPTHSGAGRIVRLRMRPLSLVERQFDQPTVSLGELLSGQREIAGHTTRTLRAYIDEIMASGFPGIRALGVRARNAQLDSYLDSIVDRDFSEMGRQVRNRATLRHWMTAYAAATATTASYETIRDAATSGHGDKPARSTTQPYRETLEKMWIVDPVPAWLPTRNPIARLNAAPKHQLADPALAARLLGATSESLAAGSDARRVRQGDGALLGRLFESLVAASLQSYAQVNEARVGHLRRQSGDREVDLIVSRGDSSVVACEVKLAHTVNDHDVRQLLWLKEQLGPNLVDMVVITTGADAYRRRDGVAVVPAALLGP
ncbi:ATP-binding protein [Aeromicrobium sp. CF4.19]|uniref:ATP-binding protein n=1 Tax=Aeromicrobium sp. CF4.19 TaxID=3373082 RepID=UPI003EE7FC03